MRSPLNRLSGRVPWLPALTMALGLAIDMAGALASPPPAAAPLSRPALPPAAQVRTGIVPGHPGWRFYDLVPDLARVRLVAAMRKGGGMLDTLLPPGTLAAVNGGYFDHAYAPTGWLVSSGTELRRPNRRTPGGVLAVKGRRAFVGALGSLPFQAPDFAVQNSPMLVRAPGIVAVKRASERRASRTVACLAEGALHLILLQAGIGTGPTLLETATLAAAPVKDGGFGCSAAVNLDGGSSTGIWLPPAASAPSSPPIVPISYGIALINR